ncbi:hypothetical protein WDU94_010109 [Cyamophila willieti]
MQHAFNTVYLDSPPCLLSSVCHCANILAIFPTASFSHQMPLLSVPRLLAQRGHNVTVVTTNPLRKPMPNYTEIDISFTYNYWKMEKSDTNKNPQLINLEGKLTPLQMLHQINEGVAKISDLQLASPQIQNFIKYIDEKQPQFDLILYEDLLHPAFLGFVHKLGHPPLVSMVSLPLFCGMDFSSSNICHPSYMGELFLGTTNKMSFLERFQNYLFYFYTKFIYVPAVFKRNDALVVKHFGANYPSVEKIIQNRSLLLVSSSWIFEYPRPLFPNTILVGPLHIEGTTKSLPKDLQNWIDGSSKGFIYFSLGSNVKSAALETSKRFAILEAFARFPEFRFIWKWEEEEMKGLPSNVICKTWLPQHDLLAHPNIKLFITQGGLQSLQEAVHYQVPMIAIPFFGDQPYNAGIIQRLAIGTVLQVDDISTDRLMGQMRDILDNERYAENVKRVSKINRNLQMLSPRETAVWWVEYVLENGGNVSHLRADYYHLNLAQYLGLDVFAVLLMFAVILIYGTSCLIRRIRNWCNVGKLKSKTN